VLKTRWDEAAIFVRPARGPLTQTIADQIKRRIVTGDLGAGRRLPPVHRLAKLCGVSVPTAHAAIQILVALGFVRVSPGVGTFVRRAGRTIASLSHGWMHTTPMELAEMRAMIDQRMPILVASEVAHSHITRLPRTLSDINFWAHERAKGRHQWPETFLKNDAAFHGAIARSVRGAEVTAAIHATISERLAPHLLGVADVLASDHELEEQHRALAAAILDGRPLTAGRIARRIAQQEVDSLRRTLG
jgi:DNA-binding FadR family transcriptional regulator